MNRFRLVLTMPSTFTASGRIHFSGAHRARSLHGPIGYNHAGELHEPDLAFNYGETPSSQILEMQYSGTGIAFDVLLPKQPAACLLSRIANVCKSDSMARQSHQHDVRVSLPKFRVESEFSLPKTLSAMGMPAAFTNQADFSGIDDRDKLFISEVLHKAFVDVSEQGTEAPQPPESAPVPAAMRAPEPAVVFRADHPFLFNHS